MSKSKSDMVKMCLRAGVSVAVLVTAVASCQVVRSCVTSGVPPEPPALPETDVQKTEKKAASEGPLGPIPTTGNPPEPENTK